MSRQFGDVSSSLPDAVQQQRGQHYLLLADISGYTSFLNGVEIAHQVDLSGVMPAGYEILGELLDAVIDGIRHVFAIEKIEGDAAFATAPAGALNGQGSAVLARLQATYDTFREIRERAKSATDHICTACPVVGTLDLKYVMHRGTAIRLRTGGHADLHSPAVNVVHRLLKNTVHARIGFRPYLLLTKSATTGLGLAGTGLYHEETYPDVGTIPGEIFKLQREPPTASA